MKRCLLKIQNRVLAGSFDGWLSSVQDAKGPPPLICCFFLPINSC